MVRTSCPTTLRMAPKLTIVTGVKVDTYHGNFQSSAVSDELTFGTISADSTLSVALQHVRTLDERQYAHIQVATLYTSSEGERRVRVCNVAVQVAALAGSVFRFADMDAVVAHTIREGIPSVFHPHLHQGLLFCSCWQVGDTEDIVYPGRSHREMLVYSPWV